MLRVLPVAFNSTVCIPFNFFGIITLQFNYFYFIPQEFYSLQYHLHVSFWWAVALVDTILDQVIATVMRLTISNVRMLVIVLVSR